MKARTYMALAAAVISVVVSCAPQALLYRMGKAQPEAIIAMAADRVQTDTTPVGVPEHDTLVIRNIDGRDMIIMRAIRDDDGQMVANQVIDAAYVTARFRNVAERHGKVDIEFQVIVPQSLQDGRWQLRYTPTLYALQDSLPLDKVVITGRQYRKRQMRGYEQYQRFIDRIITDSTELIHTKALEIFIRRNIPALYAFRTDSSFVSDEQFNSVFGVGEAEAVEHYTDKFATRLNDRRIADKDRMFRKFVKAPVLKEGIRLDTVLTNQKGDYVYNYVQTVHTRPRLKKVGIVMSGEIYEQDWKVCDIARSEALDFYISSLSAFVDEREKYITKVIERRAEANAVYNIVFGSGKYAVNPDLGNNNREISDIQNNLRRLLCNDTFDLDSVIVTASASPEGSYAQNSALSVRRGASVVDFFNRFLKFQRDSLRREEGVHINVDSEYASDSREQYAPIPMINRQLAENWQGLDAFVEADSVMTSVQKEEYRTLREIRNPDEREKGMREKPWYAYIKDRAYPSLRTVQFHFHLHRKGMVKDTVHTTVPDTVYRAGVQALKDRDYEKAALLLGPYNDYNSAVAYCALDRNKSAMSILLKCDESAQVEYMLALLYSREGNDREAVRRYLRSCSLNQQYVHRGNLDPEISRLIKEYNLQGG
ncbi:MAG: hypothetical protein KBS53_00675 [Bacteroidales bacterium]|nr:hypothetical protein [Candidatus Hennigimonas equi]